jgi:hypothetical protein
VGEMGEIMVEEQQEDQEILITYFFVDAKKAGTTK